MRKKLLSTLLATAMAVTMLAGCGSNGGQQATTPATDNKTETSAEAKTETSAEAKTETSGATGGGKVGVAMPTKICRDGIRMVATCRLSWRQQAMM